MLDETSRKLATIGGEMGERIRSFDWSQTPLGPIESWPQSLRNAVRIMLGSRYAMWMGWGPELIFLYNDAYAKMTLGEKHPWALGKPAAQVWSEIWTDLWSRAEPVLKNGEATWDEGLLLFLNRRGFPEETYHTFSYSPLPDDHEDVGGLLCVVTEDTERTIGERRLAILRVLAARLNDEAKSVNEACRAATQVLAGNAKDVPFALLYLLDESGDRARLVGKSPELLSVPGDDSPWSLQEVARSGKPLLVNRLPEVLGNVVGGAWPERTKQAIVLPLAKQGQTKPHGFLVAGVSPVRPFDDAYRGFLELLAGQIATALSGAKELEAEKRRAEELAELDRAKTVFFSNISHEFRTPLTLMLGPLQDAQNGATELSGDELALVHRNGMRLLKLVNALLDFSRIEAGRIRASFEPTHLGTYTADLASTFRAAIEKAGLRFIVEISEDAEGFVDRDMWEKIVLNLLSNAFKFTHEGFIRIALIAKAKEIELVVEDSGIGVAKDQLPRLFERFHRVEGARGRTLEGSGIGLAFVQELAKLHGGRVSFESELGKGTRVSVRIPKGSRHLPADQISAPRPEEAGIPRVSAFVEEARRWLPEAESETPTTSPVNRGVILVADDNADMRDYVKRLLSDWQVLTARDGNEAWRIVQEHPLDLLLTDVMMPGLTGFELVAKLRTKPETRDIPVIMLSARAGEEARIEGLNAGANDYLVKPFSAKELVARVQTTIELARIRQATAEAVESERQNLSSIFEQAPVAICVLEGPEHVFTLANSRYRELVGETRHLVGKTIREALPDIEGQGFYELLDGVYETGEPFQAIEAPAEVKRPDGSTKLMYLDFVYQPRFSADGHVDAIVAVLTDVTERKQGRDALHMQNQALELALNEAPLRSVLELLVSIIEKQVDRDTAASVLILDEQTQRMHIGAAPSLPDAYNQAIEGILIGPDVGSCGAAAYHARTVIVADIETDPLWKDFKGLAMGHGLRACWSSPIISSRGKVLGTFALYHRTPAEPTAEDLRLVDFATRTAAIILERDREMSRRQMAESAMRESEEQLNLALTSSNVGFWNWNAQTGYTVLSDILMRDWGIDPENYHNTLAECLNRIHDDDRKKVSEDIQKALSSKEPYDVEYRVNRDSGETVWINAKGRAYANERGEPLRLTGISMNITERKKAEAELLRSNTELARFAFVASHDLKEPLRVVSNYVQLLARRYSGKLDEDALSYIDVAVKGVQRMYALIDDLLSFSRAGATELELRSVEPREIVRQAIDNLSVSIQESKAKVHVGVMPKVYADPSQYLQLFQNLIGNAIKYRGEREPEIYVGAERVDGTVVFSVRDNGIGIAPQYFEKIFVLFQRLHNKDEYSGTGIGLSVCKKIVERHGGRIWVESAPEKGSTFFFTARES